MSIGINSLVIILVLVILVVGGARFIMNAPEGGLISFASLERPDSPNTFLVAAEGATPGTADMTAQWHDMDAAQLFQTWIDVAEAQPRTTEVFRSQDGLQVSHVQRTALMGYPDTVTAQIVTNEAGQSAVMIYSRSHYGYSDMGQNKKRVTAWMSALEQALAP